MKFFIFIVLAGILAWAGMSAVHAQTATDAMLSDAAYEASAPSGQSVAGVQWYLDGIPFGAELTSPPYTATISLLSVSPGPHTMTAQFRSSSGSMASTQTFSFSSASVSAVCSVYTSSSVVPAGFGSPYDVVSSPSTNLIQTTCDTSSVRVDLGKGDPLQYIYTTGYLYKTGGTNWSPISYTSTDFLISNAWYPKSANTTIGMTSTELANLSYVLGYLCTWTGSSWKCGCRDQACTQSYWQIQSFKR